MLEQKTLVPKTQRTVVSELKVHELKSTAPDPQRRLMVVALVLLLVALGFVFYRDRDFWFPEEQEAELDETPATTIAATTAVQPIPAKSKALAPSAKSKHPIVSRKVVSGKKTAAKVSTPDATDAPVAAITSRTVLPPLEVEVVAGDDHRTIRPGSNSVRVDLQPDTAAEATPDVAAQGESSAANLTSNAAERVEMSTDTTDVVTHPVKPGYPMLARQMKVQGSVILQALISKEGAIQGLHVVSGPPILASAAQTAVRQWRFKPHFQGSEAVETQAKITVNFTISTN